MHLHFWFEHCFLVELFLKCLAAHYSPVFVPQFGSIFCGLSRVPDATKVKNEFERRPPAHTQKQNKTFRVNARCTFHLHHRLPGVMYQDPILSI